MSGSAKRFAVRHRVPAARWPTAAEAARSRWFSPARIGRLDVTARTWVPAMVPWRATEDGLVTPQVLEGDARFAQGQPGRPGGAAPRGAPAAHGGARGGPGRAGGGRGAPSCGWRGGGGPPPRRGPGGRRGGRPAPSAGPPRRAREAGFDGVELHYAHAYTMASFLSRLNARTDGYGGSRENRVRLPLDVLAAVRARVGAEYVVGIRYLADEVVEGGSDLDDAIWFGVRFAEAGVDYLSVSKGGRFEDARQPKIREAVYPYTGASGYECMPTVLSDARGPFGRNVPLAAAIRRAIRDAGFQTPLVTSGGITTFEQAEGILERGEADCGAAARQTLADPGWVKKIRLGYGELVRRCEFTNYCEGLDQRHKQVTCKLWDRKFEPGDPVVRLANDGRRRLSAPSWLPPGEAGVDAPAG